jgi:hypothetical protein
MGATCYAEVSGSLQTTQCYKPEKCTLHDHHCRTLKSCTDWFVGGKDKIPKLPQADYRHHPESKKLLQTKDTVQLPCLILGVGSASA